MPKIKKSVNNRRHLMKTPIKNGVRIGTVPVKTGVAKEKIAAGKSTPVRRKAAACRLIASMDLDEMLEASTLAELGIRGEKLPTVESLKVQKYVKDVLGLYKGAATKSEAKKIQEYLTIQIIKQNKKMTNASEANRLYLALMDEK